MNNQVLATLALPALAFLLLNGLCYSALPVPRRGMENPVISLTFAYSGFDRSPSYDVAQVTEGWHFPEFWAKDQAITWTGSSEPTLHLGPMTQRVPHRLELKVARAMTPELLRSLALSLNGHRLDLRREPLQEGLKVEARVPADWLKYSGPNLLTLHTAPPVLPEGGDSRLLGLAVDSFLLAPEPEGKKILLLPQMEVDQSWMSPQTDSLYRGFRRIAGFDAQLEVELPEDQVQIALGVLVADHPSMPVFLPRTVFAPMDPRLRLELNGKEVPLKTQGDGFLTVFCGQVEGRGKTTLTLRSDQPYLPLSWIEISPVEEVRSTE